MIPQIAVEAKVSTVLKLPSKWKEYLHFFQIHKENEDSSKFFIEASFGRYETNG